MTFHIIRHMHRLHGCAHIVQLDRLSPLSSVFRTYFLMSEQFDTHTESLQPSLSHNYYRKCVAILPWRTMPVSGMMVALQRAGLSDGMKDRLEEGYGSTP